MSINEPLTRTGHELLNDDASGPSGSTDRAAERAKKFDEEGGDQPQAPSEAAVHRELQQVQSQHGEQPTSTSATEDQADDELPVDRESFRYQQKF